MDYQSNNNPFDRRSIHKSKAPAVQWVKEWVPQEVVSTGGKCLLLKWVKMDVLKELKEKPEEAEPEEQEPEENTEVLFLCSYEGCGKTFTDAGALRKHSHIHGERQYICHYEGCQKKFLDSSKLKRHFLIHTGERHFVCPHEGCGKAFSLDFNLRAHMRTHSQENYHICPYQDCGKRYAHEYKLKTHIKTHHEKHPTMEIMKRTPVAEKPPSAPKAPTVTYGSASSDRPYACPYEGCEKAYIHEYKLNLHLRREHPGHNMDENGNGKSTPEIDTNMDEGSDQDAYPRKSKFPKQSKPQTSRMVVSKPVQRKGSTSSNSPAPGSNLNVAVKPLPQWPSKHVYGDDDSEETEEDNDSDDSDSSDDEETEDEE